MPTLIFCIGITNVLNLRSKENIGNAYKDTPKANLSTIEQYNPAKQILLSLSKGLYFFYNNGCCYVYSTFRKLQIKLSKFIPHILRKFGDIDVKVSHN